MTVETQLGDRQEAARVVEEAPNAPRPGPSLVDELLDAAPSERDEGNLPGDEEAFQDRQEGDEQQFADRDVHGPPSSGGAPSGSAPGFWRGSRIRAGIPTASLPAGTSLVTTAPAPVRLSSPSVTGARSIVSTPRKTRSPIVVRCFEVPS